MSDEPQETADWRAGDVIGHFRLEELVGRGGMGEVWAATDQSLGRRIALKRLRSALDDPSQTERFLREARVQARLDSPHLVTVYSTESVRTSFGRKELVLVMELVEGETLDRRLDRGPLPPDEALAVLRQLAETLAVAHRAGVVHRDLKPSNLMIRPDGTLVLLDFGLALLRPDAAWEGDSGALTKSGLVVGTTSYMAPEQARADAVGPAADVWACGVLLYEMLSGRRPFAGGSPMEQLVSVLRDEPKPLLQLAPEAPPELVSLAEACLSKEVLGRPRDGEELLARLPLDRVPVRGRQARLYAPEVLARARAHDVLSPRAAALAFAAVAGGLVLTALGTAGLWPASRPESLRTHAGYRQLARTLANALGVAERLSHVESGYVFSPAGELCSWVRLSPVSLLEPRQPPTLSFPHPAEGEVRMVFQADGRLLRYERWSDQMAVARADALEVLGRASLLPALGGRPYRREGPGAELYEVSEVREVVKVVRQGTEIRLFARPGSPTPDDGERLLLPPPLSILLGLLVVAAASGIRRLRSPLADRRGAVALGVASLVTQVSKLVLNPRTLTGGVWWWVLMEALGLAAVAVLLYLALEPIVRQRWPGMLPGWMRLASTRRLDAHVGRELLLGAAALLPFGALLLAAGLGSPAVAWPRVVLFGLGDPGLYAFLLLDTTQLALFGGGILLLAGGAISRLVRLSWLALSPPAVLVAVYLLRPIGTSPAVLALVAGTALVLVALALRGGFLAVVTFLASAMVTLLVPPLWGIAWTWPYAAAGPAFVLALALTGHRLTRPRGEAERPPDDGTAPTASSRETDSTVLQPRRDNVSGRERRERR